LGPSSSPSRRQRTAASSSPSRCRGDSRSSPPDLRRYPQARFDQRYRCLRVSNTRIDGVDQNSAAGFEIRHRAGRGVICRKSSISDHARAATDMQCRFLTATGVAIASSSCGRPSIDRWADCPLPICQCPVNLQPVIVEMRNRRRYDNRPRRAGKVISTTRAAQMVVAPERPRRAFATSKAIWVRSEFIAGCLGEQPAQSVLCVGIDSARNTIPPATSPQGRRPRYRNRAPRGRN